MNERPNDAEADAIPFKLPVSWHFSEPFYPPIRLSASSAEVTARWENRAATLWFPRLVIVLTALLMALIYLTGKPCQIQRAVEPSPPSVRHDGGAL